MSRMLTFRPRKRPPRPASNGLVDRPRPPHSASGVAPVPVPYPASPGTVACSQKVHKNLLKWTFQGLRGEKPAPTL